MYYPYIYTLFVISTIFSLSMGRDYRLRGERYGRFERDSKGTSYGNDVMGCPSGRTFTQCKIHCTLYCDSIQQEPFVDCSGLSGSLFDVCEPGCVCPSDQYETTDGDCVYYEDVCDESPAIIVGEGESCKGANMIYFECRPSCMITCRNFFMDDTSCAAVCTPGCGCMEDYVYDEATSQCTLPANCTILPDLPQNTEWGCCEGDCSNPFSRKCASCDFGPKCKRGFIRDLYGDCVDYQNCQDNCDTYEIYDDCPNESTCLSDNSDMEVQYCVPGCQCQENYVRDHMSGDCILQSDCPITCMGSYEIPGCSACSTTCDAPASSVDCSSCQRMDTCVCDEGYVREGSDCINILDCGVGIEDLCDASRNQVEMCSDCIQTCDSDASDCSSHYSGCYLACGCADGYVLNEGTGECVLPSDCPICTDCVPSDNSQTYKEESCLPFLCFARDRVTYTVRFVGTWDDSSHPDFGFSFSHWSPLTGASHKPSYEIWENCFRDVTEGVSDVAEKGSTRRIITEYATHPEDVLDTIGSSFLIPGHGEITRYLDVNKNFHYITLLSMMGDTMDYMVGVDRLDMCNVNRSGWKDYVKICLNLYSTGTKTDIAPGCSSHSRQFSNCTFGYIELTLNTDRDASRCTGEYEGFTQCRSLCDTRCEHLGGSMPCPRACIAGCMCMSGYARNEKDECIPVSDCSNEAIQPDKLCEVSEWIDTAITVYPDYSTVTQMRYVTQRPTRKFSYTCPIDYFREVDCGEDTFPCDEYSNLIYTGCAVWFDTCYVESRCGTIDEFEQFSLELLDGHNKAFFEPVRTHEATTVRLISLDLVDQYYHICERVGDVGQHTCQWKPIDIT